MPAIQTRCPNCEAFCTYVTVTNTMFKYIMRSRKCTACDHRWYTYQTHEQVVSRYDIITVNKKPQLKHDPF
jgi:transcriptional regulator NrdR family protein